MRSSRKQKTKPKPKLFSLKMKKSLRGVMIIVFGLFVLLLFKVFYIIQQDSERYSRSVLAQQTYVSNPLLYKRGDIKDRKGTVLATSRKVYDLVISPKTILSDGSEFESEDEKSKFLKNKEYTLSKICADFGLSRDTLMGEIGKNPESQYYVVKEKKGLSEEDVNRFNEEVEQEAKSIEEANKTKKQNDKNAVLDHVPSVVGAWFESRYQRDYPLGTSGGEVIGYTSGDTGVIGIEGYYNDELTGTNGREYGYYDSKLNLQRTIKPAIDGNTVISTIDSNVQKIIEEKIQAKNEKLNAENIAVMIMDPTNGEVLAMADDKTRDPYDPAKDLELYYPDMDLDDPNKGETFYTMGFWRGFCIGNQYEPGSTFKPFTVAAALDEKTTNPNMVYQCNAVMRVSDYDIGCANRVVHGEVTPKKALMQSCNVTLMQIAASLGRTQFHRYMNIYGFGRKTGIDLIGEIPGVLHEESKLNTVELATSSFGQTQFVTMVEMLSAFCSLINGGDYYQPHVVKEIRNAAGSVIMKNEGKVLRQTITEETSEFIKDALKDTVKEGTATPADVEGYDIGGKTGTAEKGKRDDENYIVSFIGFTPTDEPKVAIYVVIDQPDVDDQSHSTYATEFAHEIMEDVLPFLGIHRAEVKADDTENDNENDSEGM